MQSLCKKGKWNPPWLSSYPHCVSVSFPLSSIYFSSFLIGGYLSLSFRAEAAPTATPCYRPHVRPVNLCYTSKEHFGCSCGDPSSHSPSPCAGGGHGAPRATAVGRNTQMPLTQVDFFFSLCILWPPSLAAHGSCHGNREQ